jgi:hypothetical protein
MTQTYSEDTASKQRLLGNPTNDILARYLDSVGDGSGTKNMATTTDEYYLSPPTDQIFVIDKIRISITDGATLDADGFGGIAALVNGCILKIQRNESQVVDIRDLSDAITIKSHGELASLGKLYVASEAAGCIVECEIDYGIGAAPLRLDGKNKERILFHVQDDLSSLSKVYVFASGRMFKYLK